jgi:hypothetical protein
LVRGAESPSGSAAARSPRAGRTPSATRPWPGAVWGWMVVGKQVPLPIKARNPRFWPPLRSPGTGRWAFASALPNGVDAARRSARVRPRLGSRAADHAGASERASAPMGRPGRSGEGRHDTRGTDKDTTAAPKQPTDEHPETMLTADAPPLLTVRPTNHASTNDSCSLPVNSPAWLTCLAPDLLATAPPRYTYRHAWAHTTPDLHGGSRKGVRSEAADPLPRVSPGVAPTQHPRAGRRARSAQDRNPERNTQRNRLRSMHRTALARLDRGHSATPSPPLKSADFTRKEESSGGRRTAALGSSGRLNRRSCLSAQNGSSRCGRSPALVLVSHFRIDEIGRQSRGGPRSTRPTPRNPVRAVSRAHSDEGAPVVRVPVWTVVEVVWLYRW